MKRFRDPTRLRSSSKPSSYRFTRFDRNNHSRLSETCVGKCQPVCRLRFGTQPCGNLVFANRTSSADYILQIDDELLEELAEHGDMD